MKRDIRKFVAASGAACALTLGGCAGSEVLEHIPLSGDTEVAGAIDAMGTKCATELLGNSNARAQVIRTMVGSTVVLETPEKRFIFAGKQIDPATESILGAIASGDTRLVSWENHDNQGSTATVRRDEWGMPTELLVNPNQGTDVYMVIGAACQSNLK